MKTLNFARQFIRFDKSSPITGPFQDEHYPFLRKPFEASDDIRVKRLVIFKASSCMGTVAGQIINLKRIVCDVGDQKMVCQTDDDGDLWSKTRGKEWVKSNLDAMRLLSREKYSMNNNLWIFRHKFLEISGPSLAAAQSVQVRFVQTDESHLDHYPPGRLIEFEKRMGARWDRQATHITTAPDSGKEVDVFFHEGQQDEWSWRCPKCAKLFCPLDDEDAKDRFNGRNIFHVLPCGDVNVICPHCSNMIRDNTKERHELNRDGDYEARNPTAPISTRSFQWPVFAAYWISWRELFEEKKAAMTAAKLGSHKAMEDWRKKRLCRSWKIGWTDYGQGKGLTDYSIGDPWAREGTIKILTSDPQAGKAGEAPHRHALVTQWTREGESRRIAYRKIDSAAQLHEMALEFGVQEGKPGINPCVMVDSGHEPRRTFRECGQFGWYAFRGSDLQQFHTLKRGNETITHAMPYSMPEPQSGIVGEEIPKGVKPFNGRLPQGWAFCIVGHNPELYGYLSALMGGSSGRYFGIAKDFPVAYASNMPGFVLAVEKHKKTNLPIEIWVKIHEDHYWDLEIMALVVAMRSGYFPIGRIPETINSLTNTA